MFCHTIKGNDQFTPSFSRLYLVHFSGELLFDTLSEPDIIRTDDISEKINALIHREYPLIGLNGKPDGVYPTVDHITNLPQFRFRFTKHDTVITIAVEMTDTALILQIMVKKYRQKQVPHPLQTSKADTDTFRHHTDKAVQHGDELLVLEYPVHTVHDKILPDALIEF